MYFHWTTVVYWITVGASKAMKCIKYAWLQQHSYALQSDMIVRKLFICIVKFVSTLHKCDICHIMLCHPLWKGWQAAKESLSLHYAIPSEMEGNVMMNYHQYIISSLWSGRERWQWVVIIVLCHPSERDGNVVVNYRKYTMSPLWKGRNVVVNCHEYTVSPLWKGGNVVMSYQEYTVSPLWKGRECGDELSWIHCVTPLKGKGMWLWIIMNTLCHPLKGNGR